MKIIGFVYNEGQAEMVLKGDSSLLNGRKPMFLPDWTEELGVTPCKILRISRLGKEIALRFAERYYDAVAPGADFAATDLLRRAKSSGSSWSSAIAFDYSLALGEWGDKEDGSGYTFAINDTPGTPEKGWLMTNEEAIAEASRWMTLRQGDLVYIQANQPPHSVQREELIHAEKGGETKLYCKIK